ncbi:MAG: glycosyltransferase [Planctomycetota bacterium]
MHVLHAISGLDHRLGGPVHAMLGLASYQRAAGLDVTVVSSQREGDDSAIANELQEHGVRVVEVGPVTGALGRSPKLKPEVNELLPDADIVHIHAVWDEIQHVAATCARRHGTPYIVRPCGMLDPWCLAQGRLKKQLYLALRLRKNLNGAARMHFTTSTERDLVKPLGLKPESIVEPNGINVAEFEDLPDAGAFRAMHPNIGDRPIILFLSRLHKKKGLDLLIPAFAQADVGDAVLVLVGPDDRGYEATVRSMIAEHGVENDVIIAGLLRGADRLAAFVDSSYFVLPSYQENFGVAVIEALAAGIPVVISDQVNIHDEITSADVGEVVPTEIEPLADAMSRWLKDDALREAAAKRAQPFVRTRYDWAQIARRWAEHYEAILAS